MTSVDKVKSICKERKIPISRLERDLKYANGYIGQLRKGTFPDDRLVEIANYLNVPTLYLTGEEQKEKPTLQTESERIPGYSKLSDTNRAIVDSMIAQLLAAQSED